jgi:hypothetical protein
MNNRDFQIVKKILSEIDVLQEIVNGYDLENLYPMKKQNEQHA